MSQELSEGERVGVFAARVLEDLYAVVFGERPVGVRTWCDGTALLLLLRLAGPAPFDAQQGELARTLPCDAIPELVAAAVRAQTGCELTAASWSAEADLGLVMFVFRLEGGGLDECPGDGEIVARALPGADRVASPSREGRHVPAWRNWTPVPRDGVVPDAGAPIEPRRLRLVED